MIKRLKDYPVGEEFDAADECKCCSATLKVTIKEIDETGDFGYLTWSCPTCSRSGDDIVGWVFADEPITILGKQFYPIVSRANVGPCLNCWKLVIGVPLILFPNESSQLDFCFPCANELGILKSLVVKDEG